MVFYESCEKNYFNFKIKNFIITVVITLICYYLLFIFKFKKLCVEILPEKRKLEYVIDILKKRKY